MTRTAIFVCCVHLFCISLFAQQQMGPYMAYGPEAKYFSNLNYRAYESKNGYLWFGTLNGLVRFDGHRYRNYFSDYTNPNSPGDNTVFDIAEDKNGDLWFAGFYHGATKYNQQTGKFTKYTALSKDNNPVYGINGILSDRQGDLWFCTAGRGLAKYNFEKDSFLVYYPEPSFPTDGSLRGYNFITCIRQDPVNNTLLWLGSFHGLYSFNKTERSFKYYPYSSARKGDKDILISSLEFDREGLLWIGTWGDGLNNFERTTGRFRSLHRQTGIDIVYDLKFVNDTSIYAACLNDGLYLLNPLTQQFINITPPRNPADPTAAKPSIQKISYTAHAGVLVGGNYYFYQLHPSYQRLKQNFYFPATKDGEIYINSFIRDEYRHRYWIATTLGEGIYYINDHEGRLKGVEYFRTKKEKDKIAWCDYLVKDARNRIWVLNRRNILLWDDAQERFTDGKTFVPLQDSAVENIDNLAADKNGNIWMKAGEDFIFWNVTSNKMVTFPIRWDADYKGEKKLSNCSLLPSPDGSCWLFTGQGMFHCIPWERKVKHIFKTGTTKTDLSSSIIRSAAFNKDNHLWLTSGNGLQVYACNNYKVWANHTIDRGLPSMSVNGIVTDSAGRVWIASAAGLGLFDPAKNIWQLFNRLDGLENDYLDGNIFMTSNNKLIIDQKKGFVFKDVAEIISKGSDCGLKITGIFVNKTEFIDSLLPEYRKKLSLPFDENNIDIEFAAMDWVYPFKTVYVYKIEGIATDSTWTPNPDCKISLTGLQSGKYVVHIRALNSNATWSNELIFPITIHPPFWKTWWFIALCFFIVSFFLYRFYRYRIKNFLQMERVRNAISRDLHDEIGATLSSVNMLSAVALTKKSAGEDVKSIIEQIKNSVQQAGESIDDIVWSVNPANDSAIDTFARIRKYASELTESKSVQCHLLIEEPATNLKLSMELRRDLYLICKEAVNNAMKYARCTQLKLEICIKAKTIQLLIADDGKGFDSSILLHSKRNGIGNMKHRVQKHGGTFSIQSEKNVGTTITCMLPFR